MADGNKRKRDDAQPLWSTPAIGVEPSPPEDKASKCAKLTKYCLNPISVLVHHYVRQSKTTLGKEDYKRICKTVTEHFVHNELSDRCLNELANNKKPTLDDVKMTIGDARVNNMKSILAQHGIPIRGHTGGRDGGSEAGGDKPADRRPAGPSRSAQILSDLERELSSAPPPASNSTHGFDGPSTGGGPLHFDRNEPGKGGNRSEPGKGGKGQYQGDIRWSDSPRGGKGYDRRDRPAEGWRGERGRDSDGGKGWNNGDGKGLGSQRGKGWSSAGSRGDGGKGWGREDQARGGGWDRDRAADRDRGSGGYGGRAVESSPGRRDRDNSGDRDGSRGWGQSNSSSVQQPGGWGAKPAEVSKPPASGGWGKATRNPGQQDYDPHDPMI